MPSFRRRSKRWLYALPILAVIFLGLGATWLLTRPKETRVALASVSQLPEKVRSAPPVVQEAYRFAIANPEILSRLPCYCGCVNMGHKSNLDCYIQEFKSDGSIVFDDHALG